MCRLRRRDDVACRSSLVVIIVLYSYYIKSIVGLTSRDYSTAKMFQNFEGCKTDQARGNRTAMKIGHRIFTRRKKRSVDWAAYECSSSTSFGVWCCSTDRLPGGLADCPLVGFNHCTKYAAEYFPTVTSSSVLILDFFFSLVLNLALLSCLSVTPSHTPLLPSIPFILGGLSALALAHSPHTPHF